MQLQPLQILLENIAYLVRISYENKKCNRNWIRFRYIVARSTPIALAHWLPNLYFCVFVFVYFCICICVFAQTRYGEWRIYLGTLTITFYLWFFVFLYFFVYLENLSHNRTFSSSCSKTQILKSSLRWSDLVCHTIAQNEAALIWLFTGCILLQSKPPKLGAVSKTRRFIANKRGPDQKFFMQITLFEKKNQKSLHTVKLTCGP